jgi:NADPH-dependent 2,4-dienoyl-CoA reductase/sulfur reductase-like enzyme
MPSGALARRAVLVGSGPLLYLIAAQMVRAGVPPVALVETQARRGLIRATRHIGGALRGWRYLLKGLGLMAEIMRARVPRYVGATGTAIEGEAGAEAVTFTHRGRAHRIAALKVAEETGHLSDAARDHQASPLRSAQRRELAARPFLDAAYPPHAEALAPDDATIICRCEEVTAGTIRRHARLGCIGPNQGKAFGRAGMGPCQGRYCGLTVTALLAKANGRTPDETGHYRIRPPLKPVTLGELAAMDHPASKPVK